MTLKNVCCSYKKRLKCLFFFLKGGCFTSYAKYGKSVIFSCLQWLWSNTLSYVAVARIVQKNVSVHTVEIILFNFYLICYPEFRFSPEYLLNTQQCSWKKSCANLHVKFIKTLLKYHTFRRNVRKMS